MTSSLSSRPLLLVVGISFFEDVNSLERCLDSIVFNLPMRHTFVALIDGIYKGYPSDHELSQDGSRELVQSYIDKYGSDKFKLYDYPNLHERFKRQKYVDIAAKLGAKFLLILDSDEYLECKSPPALLDELQEIDKEWIRREESTVEILKKTTGTKTLKPVNKITPPQVGNVHSVKFIDLDDQGYVINSALRPRLWYHPDEMEYFGKHYHFGPKRLLKDPKYLQEEEHKGNSIINSNINNQWTRPNSRVGMALQEAATHKSYILNNMQVWHDHSMRSDEREQKRYLYETNKLPKLEP